jgi:hypothetical protein
VLSPALVLEKLVLKIGDPRRGVGPTRLKSPLGGRLLQPPFRGRLGGEGGMP